VKIQTIDGRDYKLPNELNDFQRKMYVHLINWKWAHGIDASGHYEHKKELIPYDAILPEDDELRNKMPHIHESSSEQLRAHHRRNPFRYHPHFYHMSSSQAANINLFLPILHHPCASAILAGVKGAPEDFVALATGELDHGYCLEFWGGNMKHDKSDKGPLGDKSAKTGTDADIAIAYYNHAGELCLWLIEHKLTEKEFTTCGGFKSKGRQTRHDCKRSFAEILKNKGTCYYHDVCKYKYWDITEANRAFFKNPAEHGPCPFQGGMNQLWRNQLLALAVEQAGGPFKHAHFSVVRHPGNTALDATLTAYKDLIDANPKFTVFSSAEVVRAAEAHGDEKLREWAKWYRNLYSL